MYFFILLCFGTGTLFTVVGVQAIVSNRRKRATWLRVEGTVVGLETHAGSRGTTMVAPVYRYFADGEHTATSKVSSSPAQYQVGDTLRLLVNPLNAAESDVVDRITAIFSYGLLVPGVVCYALGALAVWLLISERK